MSALSPRCHRCGCDEHHRTASDCIAALREQLGAWQLRHEGLKRARAQQARVIFAERERSLIQRAIYNTSDRELELRISLEEGEYEAAMVRRALEARTQAKNVARRSA